MTNEQLDRAKSIQNLLERLKSQRQQIAEANSVAIGSANYQGEIQNNRRDAYFGDNSVALFFKNVTDIDEPTLHIAFEAFRGMLLSIYDQKISALEKEFESL